jgi:hypothetical protein
VFIEDGNLAFAARIENTAYGEVSKVLKWSVQSEYCRAKLRLPGFYGCAAIALNWLAKLVHIQRRHSPRILSSGSSAVIVVQHGAQPLAALHLT